MRPINADNPQVGRAPWQHDRTRYAPTDAALDGPLASSRHVSSHRDNAKLSSFRGGRCVLFDAETRAACPLLTVVETVEATSDGVRLVIRKSIDLRAALDHMRCHHSFGRSHRSPKMRFCPLHVHGVEIAALKKIHTTEIRSLSVQAVREIQERSRLHQANE